MHVARSKLAVSLALAVAVLATACRGAPPPAPGSYEVLGGDLEPFRSDFNRAADHVRAVLLVGPT